MSTGNLDNKLVSPEFWPKCGNCCHLEECKERPRHDAFPHNWHWSRESAQFADGNLILKSWVGASMMYEPHTGCYSYQAVESEFLPLGERHFEYLEVQKRIEVLNTKLDEYERRMIYNERVAGLYREWNDLTEKQARLTG